MVPNAKSDFRSVRSNSMKHKHYMSGFYIPEISENEIIRFEEAR